MTAPVSQKSVSEKEWTVSFYMPKEFQLESLPAPNDPRIKLKVLKQVKAAAIRFSGTGKKANLDKHQKIAIRVE